MLRAARSRRAILGFTNLARSAPLSLSISSRGHFATSTSPGTNLSALPMRGFFYGVSEDEELVVDLEAGVRLVIELKAISEQTQRTCARC